MAAPLLANDDTHGSPVADGIEPSLRIGDLVASEQSAPSLALFTSGSFQ